MDTETGPSLKALYPDMSDEQRVQAEANLERFLAVIWRIHERLKAEGKSWPSDTEPLI